MTTVLFFKIILKTCLEDGTLRIPKNFIKKYGGGMSNPVFLKPPDGTEWKIHWTKHAGGVWFQKGWKEFATYYSLDHGHFVLFEYKETSYFNVHIFDTSALEIDYPIPHQDGKDNFDKIIDDSVEFLGEQSPCQNTRVKSTMPSPQPFKEMKTTNVERSTHGKNIYQHVQTIEEEDGGISTTKCPKVEHLTSTKISVALSEASAFRSIHPLFMLEMKPHLVNGYSLKIPQDFDEKYLKEKRAFIMLEVLDGRSWPVVYTTPRINGGWQKFASENNLNVGDVCVFELIHKIQRLCFKVSIFRVSEDPSCSISQGENSSQRYPALKRHCPNGTEPLKEAKKFISENPFFMVVMKPYLLKGYSLKIPAGFEEKYLKETRAVIMLEILDGRSWPVIYTAPRINGGWQKFASENNLNVGDVCVFELIHKVQGLCFKVSIFRVSEEARPKKQEKRVAKEPNCSISQGGNSSQKSSPLKGHCPAGTEPKVAEKFKSENPFFLVRLGKLVYATGNSTVKRPRVPKPFARTYFVNVKQNVMIQFERKLWPVHYNSGRFSAGWFHFARESKLQGGDVCIFELVNRDDLVFDVHIFRGHS